MCGLRSGVPSERFRNTRRINKKSAFDAGGDEHDIKTRVDAPGSKLRSDEAGVAAGALKKVATPSYHLFADLDFEFAEDFTDVDEEEEKTLARGGHKSAKFPSHTPATGRNLPPAAQPGASSSSPASSSQRLSPTVLKIFQRKREQIGLSLEQLSKISGISLAELKRMDLADPDYRLTYDHAVVLARVLGIGPQEMPGLRARPTKDGPAERLDQIQSWLLSGPVVIFEGASGERFGGDVERVTVTPSFAVKVGDASLGDPWGPGMVLGFVACGGDVQPRAGDVVLLRHRRSKTLALRRLMPPAFVGLAPWQPSYVASSGEWLAVGRLGVILPRPA
jgi:transcriptional regulator with XRE-family HTH domain